MTHTFVYKRDLHSNVQRPCVRAVLINGDNQQECFALVDSGADTCVFPSSIVGALGLEPIDALLDRKTAGFGSVSEEATRYWSLIVNIENKFSLTTEIGFSDRQNEYGFGLLGRQGFFSELECVCFCDGYFFVKTRE
jgi:hypothetical protein